MRINNLEDVEKAYNAAGFKTTHKEEGAISFAREAPVVVIVGRSASSPQPKKTGKS